ncbi:MAG: DUF6544 family protein [Methylocystaceae bacterium]
MNHIVQNVLITLVVIIVSLVMATNIAGFRMNQQGEKEARAVLKAAATSNRNVIVESDLEGLPVCVQKWLRHSNVIGKERIHTVRLKQAGRMRTEPDKPWMPFQAVQYINVDNPGFVWLAKVQAAPLISMLGRDKYYQGEGSMQIKLLGLIPVVNTKPGFEMKQSTMLRFLAEMIWYPSAALNDYIKWEEIDTRSARATMTWQGVSASMVFYFNDEGDLVKNIGPRYREVNGKFVLTDWGGEAQEYREFHGIRMLSKSDVIWKLPDGEFNWLQLEVTDLDFNQPQLY